MKSQEKFVNIDSEYYIYSPSMTAMEMFLYPVQCGYFIYEPGYFLERESFNSFLIAYIPKGGFDWGTRDCKYHIEPNSFILMDCYDYHTFSSLEGAECLWCHFDGITARGFYNNITSRLGNVFSMSDPYPVISKLTSIYNTFANSEVVREALMSKYLNDILTEFMLYIPSEKALNYSSIIEKIVAYINEHFVEDISVSGLADRAGLSLYYFIRIFKREVGFTPHEYILNTRIATAQYLLKNTDLPVKDICYHSGFSGESIFCSAFKRRLGMTPTQYRIQG